MAVKNTRLLAEFWASIEVAPGIRRKPGYHEVHDSFFLSRLKYWPMPSNNVSAIASTTDPLL
jgi:hypothetical protein